MRALLQALGMFTLLPVGQVMDVDERVARRVMLAFPWAGLVCGLAAGAVAGIVLACGAGSALAAMTGLATLAAITGAMHIDGLADTADGLASRKGPEEALALMKRSDIGPMGVASAVLALLVQAAALVSLAGLGGFVLLAGLVLAPAVGRVSAVMATVSGIPGARPGGFGSLFTGITPRVWAVVDTLLVAALAVGVGLLLSGPGLAIALVVGAAVSWLVAAGWQHHLLRRLGGLTGDTFGSLIEVTQTSYLVLLALAAALLA